MDGALVAALFFTFSITGTVGLIYYYYHTRHKERMMLIEKGADAKLFKTEPRKRNYFFTVVMGIVFICLGLGIVLGSVFASVAYDMGWIRHDGNPMPYFTAIFIMIGVGFLVSYFASQKLNK
ncbi:DUF6249 domain-containing protein [Roseivirga sp.]|uniref:DUF6249 domain-containing protein n=1 Tax=Roseivirga sp. TaxID=1964215 RepID=UPI003B5210BC